jgi:hypothetical protein
MRFPDKPLSEKSDVIAQTPTVEVVELKVV